jgi:hypothetical protein
MSALYCVVNVSSAAFAFDKEKWKTYIKYSSFARQKMHEIRKKK